LWAEAVVRRNVDVIITDWYDGPMAAIFYDSGQAFRGEMVWVTNDMRVRVFAAKGLSLDTWAAIRRAVPQKERSGGFDADIAVDRETSAVCRPLLESEPLQEGFQKLIIWDVGEPSPSAVLDVEPGLIAKVEGLDRSSGRTVEDVRIELSARTERVADRSATE
jgi:hypothetical protein